MEREIYEFQKKLEQLKNGPTSVYQLQSFPIDNLESIKRALLLADTGSAIWRHTDQYHVALMYLKKGYGTRFSRYFLDLLAAGIDTPEKYQEFLMENEYENDKKMPKIRSSKTGSVRQQQASYIVADLDREPNQNSKIPGRNGKVHRTHLISARATGIENNKGLLIDYDGWLNSKPMNLFERQILHRNMYEDIIWTTRIFKDELGLHWQYVMYDKDFEIVGQKEWIDDRWYYYWFYDKNQIEHQK